ncbi:desmocollin 2-like protein [Hypanus sabinus]|uniref:desmocollin 2-like protein n=1 Tax=Hypanus sabinus TaxID=79690 RepID=UPI0028C38579|nr:desmocollin 2-like protein [Hypanus sabinus]
MRGCDYRATVFFASVLLVVAGLEEACVKDPMVVVIQQSTIKAGDLISKVDLDNCQHETLLISTNDPDIGVKFDGSLYAVRDFSATSDQKTFSIKLQDSVTQITWNVQIQLHFQAVLERQKRQAVLLHRQKRRWRPRPFTITENDIGPFPKRVQFIRSEFETQYPNIVYTLEGSGVDLPPRGLLIIDGKTGEIKATRSVDREQYPILNLIGHALNSPEKPLELTIKINDVNDNVPKFTKKEFHAVVPECSANGTSVLNLTAEDGDENNTLNTMLKYKILSQFPDSRFGQLFSVDEKTGEIKTYSNKLSREEHETYNLKVEVRDLNGANYGLSSTGIVVIRVTDMNDHAPTFEKSEYTIEVKEGESNMMVLRMPIGDKDLKNTSASRAVFKIIKGNENKNFNVSTDPKTNDGLLYVAKPLNAEAASSIRLEIEVENEAPLVGSHTKKDVTIVTVNVIDVDEGPEFVPRVKELWTEENVPKGKELGSYTAIDPETKSSSGIRYREVTDPADWISIDSRTGKIRTTAILDRESSYVKHNKYNVTVLAIDDVAARTGTGTVVINLIDLNDNSPFVYNKDLFICENGPEQFVNISAEDHDASPNTAPFRFLLPNDAPEIKNKWMIFSEMGSFAYMKPTADIVPGYFEVPIIIQDQQHRESKEILRITVCECLNGMQCSGRLASKKAVLGGLGIFTMFLAALLLLCLLMAAFALYCGNDRKKRPPFVPHGQYQQSLIVCNEEGGGQQDMNLKVLDIPGNYDENVGYVSGMHVRDSNIGNGSFTGVGMPVTNPGSQIVTQAITNITGEGRFDQNGVNFGSYENGGTSTFGRRKSHGLIEILRSQVDQVYEEEQEDIGVPYDYVPEFSHERVNSIHESIASDVVDARGLEYMNSLGPKYGPMNSFSLKK